MKRVNEQMEFDRHMKDMNNGFNDEEVSLRIQGGFQNKSNKKLEKTTGEIIFHNTFTFINIILLSIA
jgi:hypothetical protein